MTLFQRTVISCIGGSLLLLIAILLNPSKESIIVFSILAVVYDVVMIWMYRTIEK